MHSLALDLVRLAEALADANDALVDANPAPWTGTSLEQLTGVSFDALERRLVELRRLVRAAEAGLVRSP